jgi:hypothetical protein
LVEVPIMIGLVTVALWIKERYYKIWISSTQVIRAAEVALIIAVNNI